jgi:hypothetical protein
MDTLTPDTQVREAISCQSSNVEVFYQNIPEYVKVFHTEYLYHNMLQGVIYLLPPSDLVSTMSTIIIMYSMYIVYLLITVY